MKWKWVAVVTGLGSGLGAAIVVALAQPSFDLPATARPDQARPEVTAGTMWTAGRRGDVRDLELSRLPEATDIVVTVGAVLPAVLVAFMAAYAIVRAGTGRFLRGINALFLMGLAIPLQAVVIPVYLIIIRLHLYDTLLAIILPSIAFAIPLSVLVLSTFIRDVPKELFESMRMDGASEWGTLWHLAFPLTRPALVTVTIYNGLAIWNGFILPLILTQRPMQRLLPLALWSFQGQFSVNVPAVLASVVLTTLPILVLYAVGRRQLLSGLTAGFGK